MTFIISTELIRKFPFAVDPRRIRDTDESYIGYHMLKAASKEGHRQKFPDNTSNLQAEALREARRASVIQVLQMHGSLTTREIAQRAGCDTRPVNGALNELSMAGKVRRSFRRANDQVWELI